MSEFRKELKWLAEYASPDLAGPRVLVIDPARESALDATLLVVCALDGGTGADDPEVMRAVADCSAVAPPAVWLEGVRAAIQKHNPCGIAFQRNRSGQLVKHVLDQAKLGINVYGVCTLDHVVDILRVARGNDQRAAELLRKANELKERCETAPARQDECIPTRACPKCGMRSWFMSGKCINGHGPYAFGPSGDVVVEASNLDLAPSLQNAHARISKLELRLAKFEQRLKEKAIEAIDQASAHAARKTILGIGQQSEATLSSLQEAAGVPRYVTPDTSLFRLSLQVSAPGSYRVFDSAHSPSPEQTPPRGIRGQFELDWTGFGALVSRLKTGLFPGLSFRSHSQDSSSSDCVGGQAK